MARKRKNPESSSDRDSRQRLRRLLGLAQKFLGEVHTLFSDRENKLTASVRESFTTLWRDANSKLNAVQTSLDIGLSLKRRTDLRAVGLFDDELMAKTKIFEFLLEEKRFVSALKLLASIFGSFAKVFPVLSAVKELIDAALCCRDFLPDVELTTLGNLHWEKVD